jgi:hypothetical protein
LIVASKKFPGVAGLAALALVAASTAGICRATAAPAAPKAVSPAPSSQPAAATDTVFETENAEAMKAFATPEGSAYDEQLGRYLAALPDYAATMKQCMALNPARQSVQGYLRFDAQGKYQVLLRPAGEFATCITRFLEGRAPPKPPHLPYFNTLSFTPF